MIRLSDKTAILEIGRALKYQGEGTAKKWDSIRSISRVYRGTYMQGKLEMATALALSESHLRRYSQTWVTYTMLVVWWRNNREFSIDPRELRCDPRLSIGHWSRMGELMRRIEFSPQEALQRLQDAADDGVSVRAMTEMTEAEHENYKATQDRRKVQLLYRLRDYVQRYTLEPGDERTMQAAIELLER